MKVSLSENDLPMSSLNKLCELAESRQVGSYNFIVGLDSIISIELHMMDRRETRRFLDFMNEQLFNLS
jgi:hypothetical protein